MIFVTWRDTVTAGFEMLDLRTATVGVGTYLFGEFRLDPRRRLLFRQSGVIPIPERILQLLLILIEANGSVVPRETIASRMWPDAAVGDGNIAQHIYMLRNILSDGTIDRALVTTVNGRGYRLTVPVTLETHDFDFSDAAADTLPDDELEEPFRDYCHGSYLLERSSAPALAGAISAFKSALHCNQNYVPALIGLARAYMLLAEYCHVPAANAFAEAKDAIRRALAIDPSSPTAHAVLSGLLMFADWNWKAARFELDAALALNPNLSIVRNNAVNFHICAGEYDRALFEAQRALMMEPSSLSRQLLLGRALIHAGQYRQGITCISRVIESDESFYVARRYRAQSFLFNGQPEEALTDLLLLPQERSEDPCFRLPLLGRAYADSGERARAEQIYAHLQVMATTDYVASWNLAIVAVAVGRNDDALAHLERALIEREPTLLFLKSLPWFAPIGRWARFRKIAGIVGP
jgi:DNA-binding winged helix-turn-helix (wHTH) protein/Flp pilus assembly protein TadD